MTILNVKIGLAVVALGTTAGVAIQSIPAVEGFWPITVAGWLALALSAVAAVGVLYHLVKNPAERVSTDLMASQAAIEERFKERLDEVDAEMENDRRAAHQHTTEYRAQCTQWDTRTREIERLADRAAESTKYLTAAVDKLTVDLAKWHSEGSTYNNRILDALVKIAGGKNI